MAAATLTSKGQLTLPKEIREHLDVHEGDRLEFQVDRQGRVWVVPATQDILKLRGLLAPVGRARTLEEMDEAIARGAAGD
jgi:AbrB family looped-hinge helix DNA binding protein